MVWLAVAVFVLSFVVFVILRLGSRCTTSGVDDGDPLIPPAFPGTILAELRIVVPAVAEVLTVTS
jgi:uncharacterized membrane protein